MNFGEIPAELPTRWPMGYLLDFLGSARTIPQLAELGINIVAEENGSELNNRRKWGF